MTADTAAWPPAVAQALAQVLDPESGIGIVDMGFVRSLEPLPGGWRVRLTLTSAACPMTELIVDEITDALLALQPGAEVDVQLEWEPPWDPAQMSAKARAELGWPEAGSSDEGGS